MQLKASAPGSLMLLGEFAVLYGKQALVTAIDKRMHLTLTPRDDFVIEIRSSLGEPYRTSITDIEIKEPYQFVLGALKHYQTRLKRGCNIEIQSEFSDKVGLGSSAAVTTVILAALMKWLNIKTSPLDLIRQGKEIVRSIQGVGSGADIAASVYGGIVGFQSQPLSAEKFSVTLPLQTLYAGYKTPTKEVIKRVQQHFVAHPNLFRHLQNGIGQCALDGVQCLRKQDWTKLGEIMNIQQGFMESLGVSTPLLQTMIQDLRKQEKITGAKISGSGLGDCVIGLGQLPEGYQFVTQEPGVQMIPLNVSLQGVQCEQSGNC